MKRCMVIRVFVLFSLMRIISDKQSAVIVVRLSLSWILFYPSRRRHTRCGRDWSSDVCSSDLSNVPILSHFERAKPMPDDEKARTHQRWAHLRFSIIGTLLAAPPPRGELEAELKKLADRKSVV